MTLRIARLGLGLVAGLGLASCVKPPPSAYENATGASQGVASLPVGQNSAGENCTLDRSGATAAVYCGSWDQPSAQVSQGGEASAADLPSLAATGAWRAGLDSAYLCAAPTATTILDNVPAQMLSCTQRFGGWPHAALAAVIGGNVYYADGVAPALAPMQRAIGVLSGRVPAAQAANVPVTQTDQALAQRLAAQAFSAGDVGQYNALMALGTKTNQAEDFPSAVIAYRAALALQQKKLGADNPGTVAPLLELALNLSDEGQYAAASSRFTAAQALAPHSSDPTTAARLLHYRGLDQLNQNHPAQALALLQQADIAYATLLPQEVLQAQPQGNGANTRFIYASPAANLISAQVTLNSPTIQNALLGLIETRRYEAVALLADGDSAGAAHEIATAQRLASGNGIAPPVLDARLARSGAALALARGQSGAASAGLSQASADFSAAIPGSRPVAETALLRAAALRDEGRPADALTECRSGIALLGNLQLGTSAALIGPCLDIFAASAKADPAKAEALNAEMFQASELTQGSVTAQEIAAASARLSSSSSNPKVAAAIRAQQDAQSQLVSLYQQRDALNQQSGNGNNAKALAGLDKQIAAANATLSQTELAEQAAAPNFSQLVQQQVPARDVLARLRPDEAFLGITATPTHSWLFFLNNGQVHVAQSPLTDADAAKLVQAVRDSIEPGSSGLPPFDMDDAAKIYAGTLAPFAAQMVNVHELVVAPSGPLLALPFSLLPTGPASADDLAHAPWLVRQTTLAYVPAAANFVSLRKVAGTSAAKKPWFGFGDFIPASLPQAQATFNGASCGESAALFANLPQLPYAKLELQAGSAVFGSGPADELLGPDFTVPNVEAADLKNYRILHFATHGLLPTDLPCQSEPAIVTSTPPGAASIDQSLLTTSAVTDLHLDADLVLLSACNTGGGAAGGEALSGLARSFFYAGARALMVTQWSVNDQVSAYLVADTLSRLHAGGSGGAAGSLRAAQLALIGGAGGNFPQQIANPFFWAAFDVIGDGGTAQAGL